MKTKTVHIKRTHTHKGKAIKVLSMFFLFIACVSSLATGEALSGKFVASEGQSITYESYGKISVPSGLSEVEQANVVVGEVAKLGNEIANSYINGWTKQSVLNEVTRLKPLGQVLNPSTYLDANYITNHLDKFKGKSSYLVTGDTYNRFIAGQPSVGRVDGLFISTSVDVDAVLAKANNNIAIVEQELGISSGNWQGKGGIYRIDITNPENFNLRIPNGAESGANSLWKPGGLTSGGKLEAVTDPIPMSNISSTKVIQ